ncbi:SMP-30/gluconolactonase/LRE family protein [Tuwongella immobilis]|uniref:SMP-30/Gluconolactonase/LRE-like region domain-containing protein n=1 Tax=Tuwongella immobilis TaxID=692036 RepID=A0A6C2YS87_9BACT|nr:SMP-30/gluconolactonase/LRE family protein [Tuwongella immobilis]VIP04019.1 gluconolactonase : Gluconolactonase (Precursor) OS=Blastopirellula marina DSM 3645 GN=DSM3645_13073 PE=4 SV=1: SGL [Tuwongella immobilis]VTS05405.1 gluconolactonase : Gluconolactonase (Precursor) OS=Blastopirellula marina DSM 3645 GN=DSM3645_13073 PE=4 SV=1: SGL [Tuwongella immobilis]
MKRLIGLATLTMLAGVACMPRPASAEKPDVPTLGTVERLDPALDQLIDKQAFIEKLADGFDWSEGPVWFPEGYLLFSDIPKNTIWKWNPKKGIELFLRPAGYTGKEPFTGKEPGSNGLARDAKGNLIACRHGDRQLVKIDPKGNVTVLADKYDGKRFNSPNDLTIAKDGTIFFTDPPYGLPKLMDDPNKELDFQGVYRLTPDGKLSLLTKEMTRPNGVALSPDEKTLYVANSDPQLAIWKAFPLKEDGTLGEGKVLFDATKWVGSKPGLPDGLKVDEKGNLFATGPGGVLIFTPEGKHLGTLATGVPTANCGWGGDGSVLYITADKSLCRIQTFTRAPK